MLRREVVAMSLRRLVTAGAMIGVLCHLAAAPAWAQAEGRATLVDHHGQSVSFDDFRGSFVLVFFGYTHCPDICPTDLAVLAEAVDLLGAPGARVQPVFVTVDPDRDTPPVLAEYVAHFHPRLIGLTGTPGDIHALAERYHVRTATYDPDAAEGGGDYFIDHTAASYLVGPQGRILGLFQHGTPAADIAAAIRPLLDQGPR
jgi:cytochrome oxidase Cu insertion factor (SCO1/SenC/PrrC family)